MLTPYVTINDRVEFSKNKTGFGFMVFDIAKMVGDLADVYLLATDSCGADFELNNVRFFKRSWLIMFRYIFRCVKPKMFGHLLKRYQLSKGTRLRLLYYWLMSGYVDKLVENGGYDIVHIHGCLLANEFWIEICRRHGVKYVVTLHGLNTFSNKIKRGTSINLYERDFLKCVVDGYSPITVISTGMKRLIEREYGVNDCNNIMVVCNSFNFDDCSENVESIKQKYGIPQEGKILLSVGNITKNKNQIQLVRAYGLLPTALQQNTFVLFCGRPDRSCGVEEEIANQKYASHLVMCGSVAKNELPAYYQDADGVVLLSFAEGFGLSLIEGMHFGKPSITFEDLYSYEDIYDSCAVVGIPNREDIAVAHALETCLSTKWDEEKIKEHSMIFDNRTMAVNYLTEYNKIINCL